MDFLQNLRSPIASRAASDFGLPPRLIARSEISAAPCDFVGRLLICC
jgi:hypothetical protein